MGQWKRLSGKRRAAILAVALLVLATTAWGSSQLASLAESVKPTKAGRLDAPLLPPDDVFIQKTNAFGEYGNVLVSVRLSEAQLAAKTADGTRSFIVIGNPEAPVILRDDGQGGDAAAGDGLFTGLAHVDDAQLSQRGNADAAELNGRQVKIAPRFVGRAAVGVHEPEPFDYEGFRGGGRVRLGPGVAFLEPETYVPPETVPGEGTSEALISSKSVFVNKLTSATPVVAGTNAFQDRVLMIRDVSVVTDPTRTYDPCTDTGNPNGAWTFNHLVTEMANPAASGIDPADFVQKWLENWLDTGLAPNNDPILARPRMQNILNLWPKTADGKLDLAKAPLRLLAIAPRVDLRRTTGGGGSYARNASGNFLDAGEARFIFAFAVKIPPDVPPGSLFLGATLIPPVANQCFSLPFTVIFEYRIPKCDCKDVRSWAKQWMALADDATPPGSPAYNARLEALTEQFVAANANPRNPNGSALGQLRTNEVALGTVPILWELREFQLTQFPFTYLQETTTDDTPRDDLQNTALLRDWILHVKGSLNGPDYEDPIPPVPLHFTGSSGVSQNLLAGKSRPPEPASLFVAAFWKAPGLNLNDPQENWARHRVSRATCNGCHRRETFTHFVHVEPGNTIIQSAWNDNLAGGLGHWVGFPPILLSNPALPAELSEFLTGINGLGDPGTSPNPRSPNKGTPLRNFDDLARREQDIKRVAKLTCFKFHPVNADLVKRTLQANGVLPPNLYQGIQVVPVEQRVSVAVDDMTANHISEVH